MKINYVIVNGKGIMVSPTEQTHFGSSLRIAVDGLVDADTNSYAITAILDGNAITAQLHADGTATLDIRCAGTATVQITCLDKVSVRPIPCDGFRIIKTSEGRYTLAPKFEDNRQDVVDLALTAKSLAERTLALETKIADLERRFSSAMEGYDIL